MGSHSLWDPPAASKYFLWTDEIMCIGNKIGAKRKFLWWQQVGKRPGSSGPEAEDRWATLRPTACAFAFSSSSRTCGLTAGVRPSVYPASGATLGRHKHTSGTFSGWLVSHYLITRKRRWLSPPRPAFFCR